jgi:hypothetical protein
MRKASYQHGTLPLLLEAHDQYPIFILFALGPNSLEQVWARCSGIVLAYIDYLDAVGIWSTEVMKGRSSIIGERNGHYRIGIPIELSGQFASILVCDDVLMRLRNHHNELIVPNESRISEVFLGF